MSVIKEPKTKYIESTGRRKTAIARVRLWGAEQKAKKIDMTVNDLPWETYFKLPYYRKVVSTPFLETAVDYKTTVLVKGGGPNAQAESVRLGISKCLVILHPEWRPKLKALGLLKRDSRMVERKHPGTRKARRPQQWRKR